MVRSIGDRHREFEPPTAPLHQHDSCEPAQHGERAMRHVDDMHQAESDRQADRDHEQDHRVGDAVDQDAGEQGHGSGPLECRRSLGLSPAIVRLLLVGLELLVDQLALGVLFDLADVDVLDDVARLGIDPNRPARAFPGKAAALRPSPLPDRAGPWWPRSCDRSQQYRQNLRACSHWRWRRGHRLQRIDKRLVRRRLMRSRVEHSGLPGRVRHRRWPASPVRRPRTFRTGGCPRLCRSLSL